ERADWSRSRRLGGAIALMGISNLKSGSALALGANPEDAAAVMRWDLVNPWARFYELNSTHPLTALRVRELNRSHGGEEHAVKYRLPQNLRIEWGTFPLELLVWSLPLLCIGVLLANLWLPGALAMLGIKLPHNADPVLLML